MSIESEKIPEKSLGIDEKYLSPSDVAKVLNVSNFAVYKLIGRGELPAIRISKIYRIKENDLKIFLNSKNVVIEEPVI
jgi:excisionase family DNA binding protein